MYMIMRADQVMIPLSVTFSGNQEPVPLEQQLLDTKAPVMTPNGVDFSLF